VPLFLVVTATVGLAVAASLAADRQMESFLSDMDVKALDRAALLHERTSGLERERVRAEARVLADDTRVRAILMTPDFNEPTARDTLADLKRASGAALLAVLDAAGKVKAVAGSDAFSGVDLGAAPLVKAAFDGTTAGAWTVAGRLMVVGVAPIQFGDRTLALFMLGHDVGESTLDLVNRGTGVEGLVLVGDRVAAATSRAPGLIEAGRIAVLSEESGTQVVRADRVYAALVTRTGTSAGAGRLVWMVPSHDRGPRLAGLRLMSWSPIWFVTVTLALVGLISRKERT
jgi:hypothetical protein